MGVPGVVVFVLDEHIIYRSGVTACLAGLADVDLVVGAGSVAEAREHPRFGDADVLLIDDDLADTHELIREVDDNGQARVVVISSWPDERRVIAAVREGLI